MAACRAERDDRCGEEETGTGNGGGAGSAQAQDHREDEELPPQVHMMGRKMLRRGN